MRFDADDIQSVTLRLEDYVDSRGASRGCDWGSLPLDAASPCSWSLYGISVVPTRGLRPEALAAARARALPVGGPPPPPPQQRKPSAGAMPDPASVAAAPEPIAALLAASARGAMPAPPASLAAGTREPSVPDADLMDPDEPDLDAQVAAALAGDVGAGRRVDYVETSANRCMKGCALSVIQVPTCAKSHLKVGAPHCKLRFYTCGKCGQLTHKLNDGPLLLARKCCKTDSVLQSPPSCLPLYLPGDKSIDAGALASLSYMLPR